MAIQKPGAAVILLYHLLRNCDHLSVVTLSEIFTNQSTIKSRILARTTVWSKPRVNAFQAQFLFGEIQHFIILFILRKWLQSTIISNVQNTENDQKQPSKHGILMFLTFY